MHQRSVRFIDPAVPWVQPRRICALLVIFTVAFYTATALAQPPTMPLPTGASNDEDLLAQFWGWGNYALEILLILIGAAIFVVVTWSVVANFIEISRTDQDQQDFQGVVAPAALTHEWAGWTFFLRPATRHPPWLTFRALITAPPAFRRGLKVTDVIPARAGTQTNPATPGCGRARVGDSAAEGRRAAIRGAVAVVVDAAAPATSDVASDWRSSRAPSAERPARPVPGPGT